MAGIRWLTDEEFVRLYRWLECPDTSVQPPYTRAVRILMLTGQRVEEITRLHVDQCDAAKRIIDWSKTKNDRSHAIPLPSLAAGVAKGFALTLGAREGVRRVLEATQSFVVPTGAERKATFPCRSCRVVRRG